MPALLYPLSGLTFIMQIRRNSFSSLCCILSLYMPITISVAPGLHVRRYTMTTVDVGACADGRDWLPAARHRMACWRRRGVPRVTRRRSASRRIRASIMELCCYGALTTRAGTCSRWGGGGQYVSERDTSDRIGIHAGRTGGLAAATGNTTSPWTWMHSPVTPGCWNRGQRTHLSVFPSSSTASL